VLLGNLLRTLIFYPIFELALYAYLVPAIVIYPSFGIIRSSIVFFFPHQPPSTTIGLLFASSGIVLFSLPIFFESTFVLNNTRKPSQPCL
jgi:hypothetical protein